MLSHMVFCHHTDKNLLLLGNKFLFYFYDIDVANTEKEKVKFNLYFSFSGLENS